MSRDDQNRSAGAAFRTVADDIEQAFWEGYRRGKGDEEFSGEYRGTHAWLRSIFYEDVAKLWDVYKATGR